MKILTAMKVALQLQQQYTTSVCSGQGASTNEIRDYEAFVQTTHKFFSNAEVRDGEQLYAQPPKGWNQKVLTDGIRAVWRVREAMRVSGHLQDVGKNVCLAS